MSDDFKRYNKPVKDRKNNYFKQKALIEYKQHWKDKLEYDVYNNLDFKNHIMEVSRITKIDYEVIEIVVKKFLETYLKFMTGFMDLAYKKFNFHYFILIIKRGENFCSFYEQNLEEEKDNITEITD